MVAGIGARPDPDQVLPRRHRRDGDRDRAEPARVESADQGHRHARRAEIQAEHRIVVHPGRRLDRGLSRIPHVAETLRAHAGRRRARGGHDGLALPAGQRHARDRLGIPADRDDPRPALDRGQRQLVLLPPRRRIVEIGGTREPDSHHEPPFHGRRRGGSYAPVTPNIPPGSGLVPPDGSALNTGRTVSAAVRVWAVPPPPPAATALNDGVTARVPVRYFPLVRAALNDGGTVRPGARYFPRVRAAENDGVTVSDAVADSPVGVTSRSTQ